MSQKSFEILTELRPLETLFNALSDEKGILYCQQLESFSIETIRAAVKKVSGKWDRVTFPPPGVIVAQCEAAQTASASSGKFQESGCAWEEQQEKCVKMSADYVSEFMRSSLAEEARSQGWDHDLWHYVREVSMVHAQLIEKKRNISILWQVIMPLDLRDNSGDNFRYHFLKDQEQIARFGRIDVAIPTTKIQEWITRGLQRRQLTERREIAGRYGKNLAAALPPAPMAETFNEIPL